MSQMRKPLHVSIVALPEAMAGTLTGIFDALNGVSAMKDLFDDLPDYSPFRVEIVAEVEGAVDLASGLPVLVHRSVAQVEHTDLVIVPSLLVGEKTWVRGRYPGLVGWCTRMHRHGAILCSACSGMFLLAETGLFNGQDSTIHWVYADRFRALFPDIPLYPERSLMASGEREQFVSCGAATSWHDLILYLVSRFVGPTVAHAVAKFYAMQWHMEGVAPYVVFDAPTGHGDAAIEDAQKWLARHFSVPSPIDELVRRSGLPERSFKRRFSAATGFSPIAYVQRLRVEEAKRLLERTEEPVDEISWRVGYQDPAFFRRLFKRTAGISPGAYRRRFQIPQRIMIRQP